MMMEEAFTQPADDSTAPASWLAAARDARIVTELEAVYAYINAQVESRAPVCEASGRCCRFEEYQHRLYVTGLEAAYTIVRLDAPLALEDVEAARQRGGCPFQAGNLCSVHPIRPLGCRVYYCDPRAQGWQEQLTERTLAAVRRIHDRYGIPYRYGEWRAMLDLVVRGS